MRETIKALIGMSAGSVLTIFALVLFTIDAGFYVPKGTGKKKAIEQMTATRQMVCPINEFAGMEEDVWEKVGQ